MNHVKSVTQKKVIHIVPVVISNCERTQRIGYKAKDWGSRDHVVVFYYLSSGKRVRFSQFAS